MKFSIPFFYEVLHVIALILYIQTLFLLVFFYDRFIIWRFTGKMKIDRRWWSKMQIITTTQTIYVKKFLQLLQQFVQILFLLYLFIANYFNLWTIIDKKWIFSEKVDTDCFDNTFKLCSFCVFLRQIQLWRSFFK